IYDFHRKHQFPHSLFLKANRGISKIVMKVLIKYTLRIAKVAFKYWKLTGKQNESFYRFHLMSEELAELMTGINEGDELQASDGLGDLLYVVIGTSVAYWLPTDEIIQEVCKSNLLKAPRDPITNVRLRNKGKDWRPPNFKEALEKGRIRLISERQIRC
ncbi:unnamed protein product, partial [marine sediment metagenome]